MKSLISEYVLAMIEVVAGIGICIIMFNFLNKFMAII